MTKPMNRVRLFYEGDPLTARVELMVMGDDGIESVHDIPCEAATFHLSAAGAAVRSSCILKIGESFVTVHSEGPIDALMEARLRSVCELPPNSKPRPPSLAAPDSHGFEVEAITKVETPNPKPRKVRD